MGLRATAAPKATTAPRSAVARRTVVVPARPARAVGWVEPMR